MAVQKRHSAGQTSATDDVMRANARGGWVVFRGVSRLFAVCQLTLLKGQEMPIAADVLGYTSDRRL